MTDSASLTTTCTLDCPDACSLEVSVTDGRIEKIDAGPSNQTTDGFICSKVRGFSRRVYHPSRLLQPMRRVGHKGDGAEFEPMDWGQAIRTIAERFEAISREYGSEAILPYHYGGSNGFLSDDFMDELFFSRLGATRMEKTICAAPTGAVSSEMYGKMPGVAFHDFVHAKFILIWGANPKASNIHLVPYLREAKRRGAFVAMVDPMKTLGSELVDLHLPVFPGTDLPLALSMIRIFRDRQLIDERFVAEHTQGSERLLAASEAWTLERAAEQTRLPAESIERLAMAYAEAEPALIRCGWGVERNQNGGQAVAAILSMPALLGKFGVRGGGYTLSNSGAGTVDWNELDSVNWTGRSINMTELARLLQDDTLAPPIRSLFVYNCNPVATVPDQNRLIEALGDEELFTVVFDQVMTDTAKFADILLPAPTFLEQHDLRRSYGSYALGGTKPVIESRGESRPNLRVFLDLGRAMGFSDGLFAEHHDEASIRKKMLSAIRLVGKPVDDAGTEEVDAGRVIHYDFDGDSPVQFRNVLPGLDGSRVQLIPDCLGGSPYEYHALLSPEFPLALISPSHAKLVNSTLGEVHLNRLMVHMHPVDATSRSIVTGEKVSVFNELGEVHCEVRVDEHVRRGVVMMPKGAWMRSSANGRTSTALTPSTTNVVAGGACFNDARVQVSRLD